MLGACTGDRVLCAGPNPCIDYVCNPTVGCEEIPNNKPCEDLNPCTVDDFCANGQCRSGGPADCDLDDNPCTAAVCYPSVNCVDGVCFPAAGCLRGVNLPGPCEDGDPCTIGDFCANGLCAAGSASLDCDDGNLCTADSCMPGEGCVYAPLPGECSDGNPCTVGDQCVDGACVGGADPLACDDGNPCTDDLCDPLQGCRHVANSAPCDDGNICSVGDYCQFQQCRPGLDRYDCDDGNPCTTDRCLLLLGCDYTANSDPCEDGDPCTVGDTCVQTECISGTDVLDCDDGNDCTDDACVPFTGCQYTPNALICDDRDPCTLTDACVEGRCVGSGWLECPDLGPCTNEFCEPGTGCTATVVADFCLPAPDDHHLAAARGVPHAADGRRGPGLHHRAGGAHHGRLDQRPPAGPRRELQLHARADECASRQQRHRGRLPRHLGVHRPRGAVVPDVHVVQPDRRRQPDELHDPERHPGVPGADRLRRRRRGAGRHRGHRGARRGGVRHQRAHPEPGHVRQRLPLRLQGLHPVAALREAGGRHLAWTEKASTSS
ncbi:MAG: hypothetical protein M5U09_18880 [Gammaproteobacteria bacterium]|nr:hypothetical protein [Gammaproteobacteria bacterium]